MTALLIAVIVVLAAALAPCSSVRRRGAAAAGRGPPPGPPADPVPVRRPRPCRSARSTPRCGSPAPRTRRSCRCSWPGCRCTSRSTRRCRARPASRSRCRRRSSNAPRSSGSPSTPGSSAGATYRHALRQTIAHERFDRIVVAAAPHGGHGFGPEDVAWLLDNAPGEIVVLRPGTRGSADPALRAGHVRRREPRPCGARPPPAQLSRAA